MGTIITGTTIILDIFTTTDILEVRISVMGSSVAPTEWTMESATPDTIVAPDPTVDLAEEEVLWQAQVFNQHSTRLRRWPLHLPSRTEYLLS